MALGWMLSIVQRGRGAMQRLNELLDGRAGDREPARGVGAASRRGEVAFRDVDFRYPGRPRRAARARRRHVHRARRDGPWRSSAGPAPARRSLVAAAAAALRRRERQRAARRPRRARAAARLAAPPRRSRAAGPVPVLALASATTSPSRSTARPTPRRASRRRCGWPGSTATSPTCRPGSTRSSASAASRSPAGRSSARRWRASSPPRRASCVLDDALSSVDAATEREILDRLRELLPRAHHHRGRASPHHGEGRRPDRRARRGPRRRGLGDHDDAARARRPLRRALPRAGARECELEAI